MDEPPKPLPITVNGDPREVAAGTTVLDLLRQLGFDKGAVAVEHNREVVRKADHGTVVLAAGDELEVVTFLGGG